MHFRGKTRISDRFIALTVTAGLLVGCGGQSTDSRATGGSGGHGDHSRSSGGSAGQSIESRATGGSNVTSDDSASRSGATNNDSGIAGRSGSTNNDAGPTNGSKTSNDEALWARSGSSARSSSEFNAVVTDADGNVYAAGNLWGPGSLDFGNGVTPTAASDGYDALLLKYDASGTAQWAKTVAAGSNRSEFRSAAIDSAGHIYVAGYIFGSAGLVDFGNGITFMKSDAFMNAVLVTYDASGRAQWARAVTGGSNNSHFNAVTVDAANNVYAAGRVDGTETYDFGEGVTVTGVANADGLLNPPDNVVLVKYDATGAAQWAQTVMAGSPESDFASVAVDGAGNIYAAGSIAGTGRYDFGNGVAVSGATSGTPVGNEAGGNALLVKYGSSGVAQWARTPGVGSDGSGFASVAVDSTGNVHAAGSIGDGTYDFGNGVTATGAVTDGAFTGTAGPVFALVATYDASGNAQWARTVTPGGSNSYLTSVTTDSSGNVYVAGTVSSEGTYYFGNSVTIATGEGENGAYVALVKYDSSGNAVWARSCANAGSSADIFNSLAFGPAGNIYAAGVVAGAGLVDFGNGVAVMGQQIDVGPGWGPLLVKYQQ